MLVLVKRENKYKDKRDKDTVENKKTSSSSRMTNTSVFIACFVIGIIFITGLTGVVSVSATAPSITNWSSSGGITTNKDNPQDLMYLVQPGDEITFSVIANEACNFTWEVNKVEEKNATSSSITDSFTFTVSSIDCSQDPSKCIWEIHVKAYNDNGEVHHEWVISTLNESEAPDIFDYFADGNLTNRTETDPWGRPLPEWRPPIWGGIGLNASYRYLRQTDRSDNLGAIFTNSSVSYGTWKFKYRFPVSPANYYDDVWISFFSNKEFYRWYKPPNLIRFSWDIERGGHHHCDQMIDGYSYDPTQDQTPGMRSPGVWYTVTIIRTPDGWTRAYINNILDWRFRAESVGEASKYLEFGICAEHIEGSGDAHIDSLVVYNHKYFFPKRDIEFGQYVSNNYLNWNIKSIYKNGIVVKGRNITLSDIADAINDPSLFTYDAKTKTAISYTNLFLYYGSELILKNETLKFHCESDGELEFAVGYGAILRIENSTVTSDNEHYFVWNFPSASTQYGYPLNRGENSVPPVKLEWVSYNSIIINNSVINNSAYLFFQSPLELKITNSQITNLHEVDIGIYTTETTDWGQANLVHDTEGNKSIQIYTESSNLYDFEFKNLIINAKNSPVNITFKVNAYRDRLNIYNINAENENIVLDNPYAGTGAYRGQSHSCYDNGYPYAPGYIHAGIGLVNCKFRDIIIPESVKHACTLDRPGCDGRAVVKNVTVKYYLDVKVIDENGPVGGANVTVTNEVDETNHPPENMDIYRYWVTNPYCWYDYLRIKMGLPVHTLTTGSDGHTPLPSDEVINTTITYMNITTDKPDTFIVTDYKKYLDTEGGEVKIQNYTYTITAQKDGKTALMSGLDIDESWYREDPDKPTKTVVCNIDTGNCWIEGAATGTLKGKVTDKDTGAPIEGAVIKADSYSATTNSSGDYTISNLPAGDYT
ncbi:MAG: hypothetical protein DRG59_10945, partial [Deltaproteobacteria bacterium]